MANNVMVIDEEEILNLYDTNVEYFFKWLTYACEVHNESYYYILLSENINSPSHLSEFFDYYDGDIDHIGKTIKRYLISIGVLK